MNLIFFIIESFVQIKFEVNFFFFKLEIYIICQLVFCDCEKIFKGINVKVLKVYFSFVFQSLVFKVLLFQVCGEVKFKVEQVMEKYVRVTVVGK